MVEKTVKVEEDTWNDLMLIKISCKAKSLDEVIKNLIKKKENKQK